MSDFAPPILVTGDVQPFQLGTQTVTGLQGKPVSDTPPSDAQVLTWDSSTGTWVPSTPSATGTAGGDLSGSYPNPTVIALQGHAVASTAATNLQALVWSSGASSWSGAAVVNSFNSRTGAVSPTSGDYTAAQVTNAADLSSGSQQTFSAVVEATNFYGVAPGIVSQTASSYTPNVATNQAFYLQAQPALSGGTLTIANPSVAGGSTTMNAFFLVHVDNRTTGTLAVAWGSSYRFGSWTSNPAFTGPTAVYSWLFCYVNNARCVCLGTSNGTWT